MAKETIGVRDTLRALFRRKWAVIIPVLAGLIIAPMLALTKPPKYQTGAMVRRKDLVVLRSAPRNVVAHQSTGPALSTLRLEILTWTNLDRVIRQLNLDIGLETPRQWQAKYNELRAAIGIRRLAHGNGVDLILISATAKTPELAQRIANQVADNYVEETTRSGRSDIETSVDFLKNGSTEYRNKLRHAEYELEKYRRENFLQLPNIKEGLLKRLFSLGTEDLTRQLELAAYKDQLKEIDRQLDTVPQTIHTSVKERNQVYFELENRLYSRQREVVGLKLRYTARHPALGQALREIEILTDDLRDTPRHVMGPEREIINPVYQNLQERRLEIQRSIKAQEAALFQLDIQSEATERRIGDVVMRERNQRDIQREIADYQGLYDAYRAALVKAQTRLQIEAGEYGTHAEIVARALAPAMPIPIQHAKVMATGMVAALVFGVLLAFALEMLDPSVRNIEDVTALLHVPVMASVPQIVTSQDIRRRRHRLALGVFTVLLIVLSISVGLLYLSTAHPESFARILEPIKGSASMLTSH